MRKQIQQIPTPYMWVLRAGTMAFDGMAARAGAPVESWADVRPVEQTGEEDLLTVSAAPSPSNGDSNITGPPQSEGPMKALSAAPTPTNDQVWIFGANQSEGPTNALSAAPTATNAQVWVFGAGESENLATVSAVPTATNGP